VTYKDFVKTFLGTLVGIAAVYVIFISYINPQVTAPLTLSSKYEPFHDNFLLRKVQMMQGQSYETLILGSSTSEAFNIQDINHIFNTTAFHGSIGGGNTTSRFVLFKKAELNFKNLKRVIYVADLYEFNQPRPVDILSYNNELSKELAGNKLLPWKGEYLKYLFSHQLLESAFTVMKRSKKGYQSPLLKDGSTTTSMIMSTVKTEENFFAKIDPANKPKLMEEILENNVTYSRSVLANFKALNTDVQSLYVTLAKEAKDKNIELIFILSPYHAEFRKLLFQNPDVELRYKEWISFFALLQKDYGVKVYNPLESSIATDTDSGVWRDGIHYNSYAATYFLRDIVKGNEND
jgi:hypothetical protein